MSDVKIINKPEAKSTTRKITEGGMTGLIWSLWLYLLLPIINLLLWFLGLSAVKSELIEKAGYLQFIGLVEQMGATILIAFIIMRLWGIYNYYRFGRLVRRKSEMPDSMVKLSNYYQLEPQMLLQLESKKEIIWPHKDNDENVGVWLQKKEAELTPEQVAADEGTFMMRFHDVRGQGIPSIAQATLISLIFIVAVAAIILYAVGGFQKM